MANDVLSAVRMTPLSVEVSELLRRPGATRSLRFGARVEGLALPLAQVEPELALDLRLDSLAHGILARGTVEARLGLGCRRCLRRFAAVLTVPIEDLYAEGAEPEGEAFAVVDGVIDLEPAVRDALLLSLPQNPLCSEGCRGLCSVCGADRNEVACGHEEEMVDRRWEALARLREQMEE